MKTLSYVQVSSDDSSKKSLYLRLFLILLNIGINSTIYTSIPFLFYQSQLECFNKQNNIYIFKCKTKDACDVGSYTISSQQRYTQIFSNTNELSLVCDRSVYEAYILTSGTVGRIFANLVLILFTVQKENKEIFMNLITLLIGITLCSLQWLLYLACSQQAFLFGIFALAYMFYQFWLVFKYILFVYYFEHWKNTLAHFIGLPCIIISCSNLLLYLLYPINKNCDYQPYSQLENEDNKDLSMQKQSSQVYDLFIDNSNLNSQRVIDEKEDNLIEQEFQFESQLINSDKEHFQDNQPELLKFESIEQLSDNVELLKSQQIDEGTLEQLVQQKQNFNQNQLYILNDNKIYKFLPFMHYEELRTNFYIWTFYYVSIGINNSSCYYFLNQIQGDIYLKSLFSAIFEELASFATTFLVMAFKDSFKILISLKFQQQQFSATNLIHAFSISCIPSYRYLCLNYNQNPFTGLGILSLLASVTAFFLKEIKQDNYAECQIQIQVQSTLVEEKQNNTEAP
ncbi:hypothetical protein ABPG72_020262 [Tetrahymena utriculariae]